MSRKEILLSISGLPVPSQDRLILLPLYHPAGEGP